MSHGIARGLAPPNDTRAMHVQDKQAQELRTAQQEVVKLRARVQQLESDTHSSTSLERQNLSLQQVFGRSV